VPREAAERLAGEAQRIMKLPEVHELLGRQGFDVVGSTPQQFADFIRSETAKWTAIVKATGARAE
jgi:tripartite-type tricarboxylate transporter receptor subunit TctC